MDFENHSPTRINPGFGFWVGSWVANPDLKGDFSIIRVSLSVRRSIDQFGYVKIVLSYSNF